MDTELTSYDHGWGPCRACHSGRAQTRNGQWEITANPGYWGDRNPTVLVLGFSKGATQVGAIEKEPFDQIAFRKHRLKLEAILKRLGVPFDGQSLAQTMTACGRRIGYASLIRCSIAHYKNGEPVTTGSIMKDAMIEPWPRGVMSRCITQHLLPMPESIRRVVLLSNDLNYIQGVRSLVREQYPDFADINPMGFVAGGRRWVFVIHPAAQGPHIRNWLDQPADEGLGRKREQAIAAFGSLEEPPARPSSIGKKRVIKAALA